jgi:3-hydroxyisobutyrate dehydrogenase
VHVAFLGLGAMGRPMAANLAAHHHTTVWNRSARTARDHAAAHGTTAVTELEEVAGAGDLAVVCSCLPTDREVAEVAARLGPSLASGTIWLDHTSGDPEGSRTIARDLAEHGVRYLDAPVSGGTDGAAEARLAVMVGGDADVLDEVRPVLDAVAGLVTHVGPVGAGMAVKAVNNALLATTLWAAAEGLTALRVAGVDPAAALEVINASSGRSFATQTLLPERVLTRAFPRTFALGLLAKDVGLAEAVLEQADIDGPVLALVRRLTDEAVGELGGDVDHVELVRLWERAAEVELEGGAQ